MAKNAVISPAKNANCHHKHDGVLLALNGHKKKGHVSNCDPTGHDHVPICDSIGRDDDPHCDTADHDRVASCDTIRHASCASMGSHGDGHIHGQGHVHDKDLRQNEANTSDDTEAKITDINSGVYNGIEYIDSEGVQYSRVYNGIEYIDSDVVQRNGWTHHKISSGQLSLHIVSRV